MLANGSSPRSRRLDSHLASKFRPPSRDWSLTYARTIVLVCELAKTRTIHSRTTHYPPEITVDYRSEFLTSTRSKVLTKELNFELRHSLVPQRIARYERLIASTLFLWLLHSENTKNILYRIYVYHIDCNAFSILSELGVDFIVLKYNNNYNKGSNIDRVYIS